MPMRAGRTRNDLRRGAYCPRTDSSPSGVALPGQLPPHPFVRDALPHMRADGDGIFVQAEIRVDFPVEARHLLVQARRDAGRVREIEEVHGLPGVCHDAVEAVVSV